MCGKPWHVILWFSHEEFRVKEGREREREELQSDCPSKAQSHLK